MGRVARRGRFRIGLWNVCVLCVMPVLWPLHASEPGAPLPAYVPWNWTVQKDLLVGGTQLRVVSERLGGKVSGLRNTTFSTDGGGSVQINVIVGASDEDARLILESLHRMKSPDFVIREDRIVHEFVGDDAVREDMLESIALLKGALAR